MGKDLIELRCKSLIDEIMRRDIQMDERIDHYNQYGQLLRVMSQRYNIKIRTRPRVDLLASRQRQLHVDQPVLFDEWRLRVQHIVNRLCLLAVSLYL
jgi:hypothetical protein